MRNDTQTARALAPGDYTHVAVDREYWGGRGPYGRPRKKRDSVSGTSALFVFVGAACRRRAGGASSLALLCSAAASSISTAVFSSGDRSKFTSIPSLSSLPGWSLRPILKRQRFLAAITDEANKHNVERATPATVDAAGHPSVSRVRLAVVGVAVADLRWRQRRHLLISAHRADWKAANNYVASHLPVQIHNANAGGIRIILNVGLKHLCSPDRQCRFGVRIVQHHSKKQHSIPAHSLLESS